MKEKTSKTKNYYECRYRGTIQESTYSCCSYPGNNTKISSLFNSKKIKRNKENAKKLHIIGHSYGIGMGQFKWPVSFDPIWLKNCDGFSQKENRENQ